MAGPRRGRRARLAGSVACWTSHPLGNPFALEHPDLLRTIIVQTIPVSAALPVGEQAALLLLSVRTHSFAPTPFQPCNVWA